MHQMYNVNELTRIICHETNDVPEHVLTRFIINWLDGNKSVFRTLNSWQQMESEIFSKHPGFEISIRGKHFEPCDGLYPVCRHNLIDAIINIESFGFQKHWHRQFNNSLMSEGKWPHEGGVAVGMAIAEFIKLYGINSDIAKLMNGYFITVPLSVRYCMFVEEWMPGFLKDALFDWQATYEPRGRKKGASDAKEFCYKALEYLIVFLDYQPRRDGAQTAAELIQQMFDPDVKVGRIRGIIEEYHNEIARGDKVITAKNLSPPLIK